MKCHIPFKDRKRSEFSFRKVRADAWSGYGIKWALGGNLLIPKTDYRDYFNGRYNVPGGPPIIMEEDKKILFSIREDGPSEENMEASYRLITDYNLSNYKVIIPSYFRTNRDKLVNKGHLNLPFTDTQEYREILKSQIKELTE